MSRSKAEQDIWDQIFDDLILETEPPVRYIKDAVIVTKNGTRFRVSPDDFAGIVARERTLDSEQSDIQSCSLSIDFSKIKRDVNRWTNRFIGTIESAVAAQLLSNPPSKKRRPARRKVD